MSNEKLYLYEIRELNQIIKEYQEANMRYRREILELDIRIETLQESKGACDHD